MNGSEKHYLERLLDPEDRDMIEKEEHFSQVMEAGAAGVLH